MINSEHLIKSMADRLVNDGYLAAGYEYIIVDDCWLSMSRDSQNRLQPDPKRFPSGIRALADYVHSLGLKFGIYEDYGTKTCGGYPGSIDHLELDAKTFAEWTVDYLKLDGCYADIKSMEDGYPLMGKYLNETGRPIVYSCSWPAYLLNTEIKPNYPKISQYCNLWRNFDDIDDSWNSVYGIVQWYVGNHDAMQPVHAPGSWNDPDMLIIGNYGMSLGQSRAQMALWSIMAAPLIMSNDLRSIRPEFAEILKNKNMILINQDKLGKMGKRIIKKDSIEIWAKDLESNKTAFVFLNTAPYGTPNSVKVSLADLTLTQFSSYNFYESFSGDSIGEHKNTDIFSVMVDPSGSVFAFWAEPIQSKVKIDKKEINFLE